MRRAGALSVHGADAARFAALISVRAHASRVADASRAAMVGRDRRSRGAAGPAPRTSRRHAKAGGDSLAKPKAWCNKGQSRVSYPGKGAPARASRPAETGARAETLWAVLAALVGDL